eukprot:jgi/Picsp_1/6638/NSC_03981-R1_---NA---
MNFHFVTVPSLSVTSEDQLHFGRGENDSHEFENDGHYALEKSLEVQFESIRSYHENINIMGNVDTDGNIDRQASGNGQSSGSAAMQSVSEYSDDDLSLETASDSEFL